MNYYEALQEVKALGLNPIDIMIASEVDYYLKNFLDVDEMFDNDNYRSIHEFVCWKVKDIYLSLDNVSIETITRAVFKMLSDGYTSEEINKHSDYIKECN